jgi:hypothetical protein
MKAVFFLLTPAIALGMAIASGFRSGPAPNLNADETISQATNGAYRDGLFVGKLSAEHGAKSSAPIGRWARAEDRASFTAGYQRGYGEFLATHVVTR